MQYNVLDLFCGCGGMSKGLEKAGLNIIAGIDIWDKAIASYKQNYEHQGICEDLTKLPPDQFQEKYNNNNKQIDIIVGGPPCQGFSMAGKRDTKDPRNSLFMEYVKYIDYYKPKAFLMENVMGILSKKTENGILCIDIISEKLSEQYNIKICKLYASDFEVPQNRRRVLIFGIRKDLKILPVEPEIFIKNKEDRIPVSTVLENEDTIHISQYLSEKAIAGIIKKKNRMVEESKGFGAQFLDLNKPSFTIPARYWKDGYDALVKYSETKIRRLTINELKLIQSFPASYEFVGNKKDVIMQIGNAVACKFAFHIANHLKNMLVKTTHIPVQTPIQIPEIQNQDIDKMKLKELKDLCKNKSLKKYSKLNKNELIQLLKNS